MSDIENVKKLRLSTGAGFKDCNIALKEANGDLEKAAEILRVKGIAKASKKMSRNANEGVIAVSGDSTKTSLIEINCETDFVAKNDDFIIFVKELSEINNLCSSNIEKLNNSKMKNGKSVKDNLVNLIRNFVEIEKNSENEFRSRVRNMDVQLAKIFNELKTGRQDNLSELREDFTILSNAIIRLSNSNNNNKPE